MCNVQHKVKKNIEIFFRKIFGFIVKSKKYTSLSKLNIKLNATLRILHSTMVKIK